MSDKKFIAQLTLLSLVSGLFLVSMHFMPRIQADVLPSWIAWAGYILMTVAVFVLGRKTVRSSNPNAFTLLALSVIIVKLLFSAAIILIYVLTAEPVSNLFLLPFFLIYIAFSIFEARVFIVIGKT